MANRTALAVCLLVHVAGGATAASPPRPNIVLLLADDLGYGDVACHGHPDLQTPHLDAMAAAGLRFERFYAQSPVCSPTRGSCLTGRHPYRYGIYFANVGHLPPEELTLAELLKGAGYATGHFGKWHLGTLTKDERDGNRGGRQGTDHYSPPWENGFDTCFSTESKVPTWDPLLKPAGASDAGPWWDPVSEPTQAVAYGTAYWSNGRRVTEPLPGDDSRLIMDQSVAFIRRAVAQGRPFFAVVWFHAPHLPVVAGDEYAARYSRFDKYRQHYYGCITALDAQVGRLRDELRRLGVAHDTLLWFASDNGPEGAAGRAPGDAGPLRGRKRDLFEGGIRVPAILEWPARIAGGRTTRLPACTSDYLPTILDLLAIEPVDDRPLDGISLVPLIEGTMTSRPRPIFFETPGQVAVSDNRYKIIRRERAGAGRAGSGGDESPEQFMLFDLLADPGEQHDLADEHPEIVSRMATALEQWRAGCRASRNGADYSAVQ